MMPVANFDKKAFNQAVGDILSNARLRTNLSIEESCAGVNFTSADLEAVESGLRSLPGNVLYQFFEKYKFTQDEMRFFCFVEETRQKFIKH